VPEDGAVPPVLARHDAVLAAWAAPESEVQVA
jgi:hypothetical protein